MEGVKATDALQNLCGSHFARFLSTRRFFQGVSLTGNSDSVVSDGGEDRTSRRTHISLCPVSLGVPHLLALFTRTCVRVAQDHDSDMIVTCCTPARLLNSHPISQHVSQTAPRHA